MEMDLVDGGKDLLVCYASPERHRWRYGGDDWQPCTVRWLTWNFLDRWYSASAVYTAEGEFRYYYCDIQTPAKLVQGRIDCIDLDLDVVVRADGSVRLLDEDEFELHQRAMNYPLALVERAWQAVDEVHDALARKKPPFDGSGTLLLGRSWAAQGPL
jgi:protein associated with RNAse G/E